MSRVVVAKFGGSSMADAEHFTAAKQIIARDEARRYVVPSAPGKRRKDDHKVTDLLYMCHQLAEHNIDFGEVFTLVANRYRDIYTGLGLKQDLEAALEQVRTEIIEGASEGHVASRGEYLNGLLLAEFLGYEFVDAADVVVFSSDGVYDADATMMRLGDVLGEIHRAVIPGFYGADQNGSIHTFSRGGSDVSGAIVAGAVGADLYENWTDVSGFLQADPRVVNNPAPIETVSYKELRELSYMGASVLHEEAIFPVREKSIPINVRNTERPEDPGTLIVPDSDRVGHSGITGIAGKQHFAVLTLEKTLMDEEKGFVRKLVSVFETNGVSIAHIPSGIDSVSVVVRSEEIGFKLAKVVEEIKIFCHPDAVSVEEGISLIAVVGRGMVSTPGIAARVFTKLARAKINIRIITQGASELSILIGVEDRQFDDALRTLYSAI